MSDKKRRPLLTDDALYGPLIQRPGEVAHRLILMNESAVRDFYENVIDGWGELVPYEHVKEVDGDLFGGRRISGGRFVLVPITRYEYDLSVERGATIITE